MGGLAGVNAKETLPDHVRKDLFFVNHIATVVIENLFFIIYLPLSFRFPDVFGDADGEAGRGDHHRGLGRAGIGDLITLRVFEALLPEHLVRLVEVAHVHANARRLGWKVVCLRDV